MRKLVVPLTLALVAGSAGPAAALSDETALLLDLLQAKGVISQEEATQFAAAVEARAGQSAAGTPNTAETEHRHSVRTLEERLERVESAVGQATAGGRLQFSGVVEVEASLGRQENNGGAGSSSSDVVLATAELDVDGRVNDLVTGHLALLYEEGKTEPPDIDEAYIAASGDDLPWYGRAGRVYLPFGNFESHFITDPLTLTLGETNDSAVLAGYTVGRLQGEVAVFQPAVTRTGHNTKIDGGAARLDLSLDGLIPQVTGGVGVSWLSNLAASDSLREETTTGLAGNDPTVADPAAGFSAYLHLETGENWFFDAEYLGAVDSFAAGDLSFTDLDNRRPRAWNVEAAYGFTPALEAALRVAGSRETGGWLAAEQYGGALLYQIRDNTTLTVEYLEERYRGTAAGDPDRNHQGTAQLAVEF